MMSRFCSLMHPIVEANEYPQPARYVSLCKAARSLTGRARPRVNSCVTRLTFGKQHASPRYRATVVDSSVSAMRHSAGRCAGWREIDRASSRSGRRHGRGSPDRAIERLSPVRCARHEPSRTGMRASRHMCESPPRARPRLIALTHRPDCWCACRRGAIPRQRDRRRRRHNSDRARSLFDTPPAPARLIQACR